MTVIIAKWVTSTELDSGNEMGVSSQGEPVTVDTMVFLAFSVFLFDIILGRENTLKCH